ncbi:MAG: ComF family protein [Halothiobacillaceae bacterium]|nr:MAG: ComF family protein [Halothiobacillaceae bacterium]TQV63006.1 MAG: ComF family protein [Halothiobacillaceae bacterium]
MRKAWPEVVGSITDWLLPRRCLLCDAPAGADHLCEACADDLPRIPLACPCCARPVVTPGPCAVCLKRPPPFDAAIAPLDYAGAARHLVTRFKFGGRLSHGVPLAHHLIEAVRRDIATTLPDALIPVPIHPRRLRERGYNQSMELARPLARRLGIPLLPHALQRVRATTPQMRLPEAARAANVRGAFAVHGDLPAHVALIDDVLTTGATVGELARLLKREGCERVDVWCATRAT